MHVIDLSHELHPGMPVYPGTMAPRFEETATLASNGYREKRVSLCVHTGTHVDAPAHIISGAKTLDQLPVETFCGEALLLDAGTPGKRSIGREDLRPFKKAIGTVRFVLLRTGWSRYWGTEQYFADFPTLTPAAAQWLVDAGVKGVGLDALSADAADDPALPVHHLLLGAGVIIVENLTRLSELPASGFTFTCLPLRIRDADGSPVRAAAILP